VLLSGGPVGLAAAAPRAEALLLAADRAHHVATVVRPALDRGAVVISERYVDSAVAYQQAGRTLPVDEVAWLSDWATGGLRPDLVILLDIDPSEGLARAAHWPDAPDPQTLHFAEQVRCAFLDLSAQDPGRYQVLDASRPVEAVADQIAARIDGLLPPLPPDPTATGPAGSSSDAAAGQRSPAATGPQPEAATGSQPEAATGSQPEAAMGPPSEGAPVFVAEPPAPLIAGVATSAAPPVPPSAGEPTSRQVPSGAERQS
jgi:dTMP kinase